MYSILVLCTFILTPYPTCERDKLKELRVEVAKYMMKTALNPQRAYALIHLSLSLRDAASCMSRNGGKNESETACRYETKHMKTFQ